MKNNIDYEAIKEHIRGILTALGDDPDREGLKETPDRVARMYGEVFEGMRYSNAEIAEMFNKSFEDGFSDGKGSDIVFVADDNLSTLADFKYKRKCIFSIYKYQCT